MSEGKKEILLGDCLELMKDIPNGSIDMILADLPYGTTACKWDSIIDLDLLWIEYKRAIKDNGAIVLTASQPFTTKLISSNYDWFKYELIWEKDRPSNVMLSKKQVLKYHENILVFYKKQCTYNPQMRFSDYDNRKRKGIKYDVVDGITEKTKSYVTDDHDPKNKYPKSVLYYSRNWRPQDQLHSSQKPTELFEYLIKTYTNEGELVLDNTAGSCTTAIAALNTNRDYICMEKDENYYNIGLKRVKEWHENKNLNRKKIIKAN
jgi:site-specific DNA-methyltransferase (adenine-specific)